MNTGTQMTFLRSFGEFWWWVLVWGPTFKVVAMTTWILKIKPESKPQLPEGTRNLVWKLIGIFGAISGIQIALYTFNFTSYILVMIFCYLVLFILSDYFHWKLWYYLLAVAPLASFLGYMTGDIAKMVQSPHLTELVLVAIPLVLPYVHYKLVYTKDYQQNVLEEYSERLNKHGPKSGPLRQPRLDIIDATDLYRQYQTQLKLLEKDEQRLKYGLFSRKTKPKNNISINRDFLLEDYSTVKNKRLKGDEWYSEFMSVLSGGVLIGGSPEESILKAAGHFEDATEDKSGRGKKIFVSRLESTKAKTSLAERIKRIIYLRLYLSYWNNKPYQKLQTQFLASHKLTIRYIKERNKIAPYPFLDRFMSTMELSCDEIMNL